ncbi:Cytotoxic [Sinosporangium album]|uniref:Cytotoxic n=1 Tax=Sinosporangium album TaxID=504805 RepID=A0A1G8EEW2_9ACTN|nr:colicin E3/pyocin S6 family cytotoxin [Sinosporangium album]SDH68239.1 Cytotoxic [Sinosporangium album]
MRKSIRAVLSSTACLASLLLAPAGFHPPAADASASSVIAPAKPKPPRNQPPAAPQPAPSGRTVNSKSPATSPFWNRLRNFKAGARHDDKYVYEWDYLHGDIERFNKKTRKHAGSLEPVNGTPYKPAVPTHRPKTKW